MANQIKDRFRKYLPVVVDIETSGIDPYQCAILELCAITVSMDSDGKLNGDKNITHDHVAPFEGAHLDKASLEFNKIDPFHPFREAKSEKQALEKLFAIVNEKLKVSQCQRAVLVGHNAWFDLLFINQAVKRNKLKSPFHRFTSFDTATLSAVHLGETVLAKACKKIGIDFDTAHAHSAIYDCEKTAELFCQIVNEWHEEG